MKKIKVSEFKLTPKAKQVIMSFIKKKEDKCKHLETDGKALHGNWFGGRRIAYWNDGKIVVPAPDSRSKQTVIHALEKLALKSKLASVASVDENQQVINAFLKQSSVSKESSTNEFYYMKTGSDGEAYYYRTGTLKNGGASGYQVSINATTGFRPSKPKKVSIAKMDIPRWKSISENDVPENVMAKFLSVMDKNEKTAKIEISDDIYWQLRDEFPGWTRENILWALNTRTNKKSKESREIKERYKELKKLEQTKKAEKDVVDQSAADKERLLKELHSHLADLVSSGALTEEEANEWLVRKQDQWFGGDDGPRTYKKANYDLYYKAIEADEEYTKVCNKYGGRWKADKNIPEVKAAYEKKVKADEALMNYLRKSNKTATNKHQEVINAFLKEANTLSKSLSKKWEDIKNGKRVIISDDGLDKLSDYFRDQDTKEADFFFSHLVSILNPNRVGIKDKYIAYISKNASINKNQQVINAFLKHAEEMEDSGQESLDLDAAIMNFFKENPSPKDEQVHEFADSLGIEHSVVEGAIYGLLSSFINNAPGKHKDSPDEDFDPEELKMGIEVEKEHTDDESLAKEIAKDHLSELKNYYSLLKEMEAKGEQEGEETEGCPCCEEEEDSKFAEVLDDFLKEAAPRTYKTARDEILKHLKESGWELSSNPSLKVPYATSPDGTLRLWFKSQAVYFTKSTVGHSFKDARTLSYNLDIRKVSPERFLEWIEEVDKTL